MGVCSEKKAEVDNLFVSRVFLGLAGFLICGSVSALDSLIVAPGDTYVVSPSQGQLSLERLELGNGAKIKFAPTVLQWRLSVKEALIGDDVVIDGRGLDGSSGENGSAWLEAAPACDDGEKGKPGESGLDGKPGVSLTLMLGVSSLGSLEVNSEGGNGGKGGDGANGQDGGKITSCYGPNGGDGGDGAAGGKGAQGGNISISVWDANNKGRDVDFISQIIVKNKGGSGAEGGLGGQGGDVVPGRLKTIAGPGIKKWLSAGNRGTEGKSGDKNVSGRDGQTLLSHRPADFYNAVSDVRPKAAPQPETVSRSENSHPAIIEVKPELENKGDSQQEIIDEIRLLRERLNQLEKKL